MAKIHQRREPIWHIQIAIAAAIGVQLFLSPEFVVGPRYALAVFEVLLLLALSIPHRHPLSRQRLVLRRFFAVTLLAIISATNIASLALVCDALLNGQATNGHLLIYSALAIYATNIIVFGLLYWELDDRTDEGINTEPDFLFPQMTMHTAESSRWLPRFFDYLYISITNASAFSPTDSLPLTQRAKLLMSVQAFTSLATVALVAARAINILR